MTFTFPTVAIYISYTNKFKTFLFASVMEELIAQIYTLICSSHPPLCAQYLYRHHMARSLAR